MAIDEVVEKVNEGGNLLANLALIKPETWEDSVQVFKARDFVVITANMAIYKLVDGELVFELLGKEGNPFMDETLRKDAYNGIVKYGFFFPQSAMKEHIKAAKALVTVRYSGLRLKTKDCSENCAYVKFNGKNNDEEKKLFNGVYGTDNLRNGTTVYLLRENVVEAQLRNRNDELIARACYFDDDRAFYADVSCIDHLVSAVRWVRRVKVAEGDAQKSDKDTITQEQAVRYFAQNPVITSGGAKILSEAANAFYRKHA